MAGVFVPPGRPWSTQPRREDSPPFGGGQIATRFRVERRGGDAETLFEARTGAGEERRAVDQDDASRAHRPKVGPFRPGREGGQFGLGAFEREAARSEQDDLGSARSDFVPGETPCERAPEAGDDLGRHRPRR